jgi:hypothetical protein
VTGPDPLDPRARFRLWIDQVLVEDVWVDFTGPDAEQNVARLQARQLAQIRAADDAPYLIEIYDPAQPPERAYLRFGTDRTGMYDPQPYDGERCPGIFFAAAPEVADDRDR